jgi:RsiW-degrading membrane proteinase PrsW (M82 family)
MLQFVITIILTGLLTWLYARAARNVDRFEKEPFRYLLAACVWGAVPAIVLSVVLQLVLDVPAALLLGEGSLGSALLGGAIVAPATEEVAKGLAVAFLYLARRRELDGWVDGLLA